MSFRKALNAFITTPEQHLDVIVYYDELVTIVKDKFPKSTFHLLVLPRSSIVTRKHPTLLTLEEKRILQPYIDWAQDYIFHEFSKEYKQTPGLSLLPFAEDTQFGNKSYFLSKFIQVGVHSIPSMENLHIHVMTRDFYSPSLKNKKHYNSFTTSFFVVWDEIPLAEKPDKERMENTVIKKSDLKCSYCGKNFSNSFSQLKKHIDLEFTSRFTHV